MTDPVTDTSAVDAGIAAPEEAPDPDGIGVGIVDDGYGPDGPEADEGGDQ